MHLRKRIHPLSGSKDWVEFESHDSTRKVWNGRANLDELEADGPSGHIEGLTLRLYNPHTGQWSIYWANSANPTPENPLIGEFKDGRGEFYDQEMFNGRSIFVRFLWTNVSKASGDFEQSFSADGGRTWEANWVTTMEREPAERANVPPNPDNHNGQHDFDFEFGRWKVQLQRLAHPLSGQQQWLHYGGTIVVSGIWNGRGNIVEFEAKNDTKQLDGLSLRLFDPHTHQWSMWWANAADGTLDSMPVAGKFETGGGEFYGFQKHSGRWVMVRFIFSRTRTNSVHGEQAYSIDGGKTWEPNWVEDLTRD
ncbi:MAG: hypothetical protein JO159_00635 [Acidobacteria bacterium]|nr:hypothetical protein [Acidobacteriota bacterium]